MNRLFKNRNSRNKNSEKAMAPHSSTLAWKIPWTEEPGRLQSMGSLRAGHDWETSLSLFTFMHWRRKWQPTPVFLPGESQGQESLVGWRLWGHTVGHDWSDLAAAAAGIKTIVCMFQVTVYVNNNNNKKQYILYVVKLIREAYVSQCGRRCWGSLGNA